MIQDLILSTSGGGGARREADVVAVLFSGHSLRDATGSLCSVESAAALLHAGDLRLAETAGDLLRGWSVGAGVGAGTATAIVRGCD